MKGLCQICGKPARLYTCMLCGRQVCGSCFDKAYGICIQCKEGKRGNKPDEKPSTFH
ncbi:MAG TPA: hypothetical protein HA346_04495 [Thermoplasmata archaeon]|nr:hypothetical protein [Thermoplasmata archaeon]HIH98246.1 hypothetical protein [Thermoplasmata archaeon]